MNNLILFLAEGASAAEGSTEATTEAVQQPYSLPIVIISYSLAVAMIFLTILFIILKRKNSFTFRKCKRIVDIEATTLNAKVENKNAKGKIKFKFTKLLNAVNSMNIMLVDMQTRSNLVETGEAITLSSNLSKKISRFVLKKNFKSVEDRNKNIESIQQDLNKLCEKLDYISTYVED